MGATHGDPGLKEVEELVHEFIERDMLDDEVEREVEEFLGRNEPREALELAYRHNRATRRGD